MAQKPLNSLFVLLLVNCLTLFPLAGASRSAYSGETGTMVKVFDLRTEYKENPLGLDVTRPRLSWKIASDAP